MRFVAVEPTSCPTPDQGRISPTISATRRADAADEDVHARPHIRPAGHSRRRAALPRHGAAALPALRTRARSKPKRTRSTPCLRRRCSSPAPRASFPRRRAATPSAPPSTRRSPRRKRAKARTIFFNLSGHGLLRLAGVRRLPRGQARGRPLPRRKGARSHESAPGDLTMTTVSTSPLAVRIRAVLEEKSMLRHPFYQSWTRGDLPLAAMQEYARQYSTHFEAAFPRLLSAIHARTESAEIRESLLDNLWDEEHGPRNHAALWLEFAAALGLSSDEVTGAALRPQTAALIRHYERPGPRRRARRGAGHALRLRRPGPQIAWQKLRRSAISTASRPNSSSSFPSTSFRT